MEHLAEIPAAGSPSAQKTCRSVDPWHHALGRDVVVLAVAATISLGVGLTINQLRGQPLPLVYVARDGRLQEAVTRLGRSPGSSPAATPAGIVDARLPENVDVATVLKFVQAKRGLVLDARAETFHRLGHIPGAVSLPREDFENAYAQKRALLEGQRTGTIIVYCSDASCEDGRMVADALQRMGYAHVSVFGGGWDEWTQAGLPEERK